jgi:hypothetical protein
VNEGAINRQDVPAMLRSQGWVARAVDRMMSLFA